MSVHASPPSTRRAEQPPDSAVEVGMLLRGRRRALELLSGEPADERLR